MVEPGIVIGVVGIINQTAQRLTKLKERYDEYKSLPENWNATIASFDLCKKSVESVREKLAGDKDYFCELDPVLKEAEASLEKANPILKDLEDEFTGENASEIGSASSHDAGNSSRPGCWPWRCITRLVANRPVNEPRLFVRVNKAKSALEKLDSIWKEAKPSIERVIIAICVIEKRGMANDKYIAHFDEPLLPNNTVLNFSNDGGAESEISMEASLMHEVLSEASDGRVTAAVGCSVHGVVGMGGVGKTVALQGLCREPEVRRKYCDGVFFVSLGQDATEKDVIEGIAHFVDSSGGKSDAKDIASMRSAGRAAGKASLWFKGRRALFVCDDIWSFEGHPIGYLNALKILLCNAPSSAIVISTREKSISKYFVEVEFSPRQALGQEARNILAKYAGIESEAVKESGAWAAFKYILNTCAGLPVALGVAGTDVRILMQETSGGVGLSAEEYAKDLRANVESVGEGGVEEYRGFRAVVETSLQHCEKWARSGEGRGKLGCELNVREKFEALSVLRKQSWMPWTCLKRLWETDERATKQLLCKLSDLNLVLRRWHAAPGGMVAGLALHDLVLEQVQRLADENNRASVWHARLLDGYVRKAACTEPQSNSFECREWWNCEKVLEDGYIEKNVARHLGMSEGCELELLLSDVRWLMRRRNCGGLVSLRDDFREVSQDSGSANGADSVYSAVEESWVNTSNSVHTIAFEMYGRLQGRCSSSGFVERFLSSVSMHAPKPQLIPKKELRWRMDARERYRLDFEEPIRALGMNEELNLIAVTQKEEIHVFDLQSMWTVCTLEGHDGPVTCVAMSGDGRRIISGSWDETVRVWDGESGECVVGPLRGHEGWVRCVGMSEDGSRIVSGSLDETVRVWDGESGECVVEPLRGHKDWVECIRMSGDGSRIVSGSHDGTVRVWYGKSGECVVGPVRGHEDSVECVGISGDGSRIFSRSRDGTVRIWDVASGECVLGPLRGHEDSVQCVGMNWDGSRIVSGSDDKTVRVWDGQTGEEHFAAVNFAGSLRSIEFEDHSPVCVISTSEEVFRLDTSNGTKMPSPGYMLENNGKIFVSGENAETVQVAVMPFRVHTFCFNMRHSKAVAGLGDGQFVIAELTL